GGVDAPWPGYRGTTRSDDELADAPLRVGPAVGILRREPFVQVVVRGNDHVGIEVVQRTPEGARGRVVAVLPGGKEGKVPVRQRASRRICRQLRAQPLQLRRALAPRNVAVQRINLPVA